MRTYRYVDPNQNVYDFITLDSEQSWNRYFGTIIWIRPGYSDNINNWKVGDPIMVSKCVCVRL